MTLHCFSTWGVYLDKGRYLDRLKEGSDRSLVTLSKSKFQILHPVLTHCRLTHCINLDKGLPFGGTALLGRICEAWWLQAECVTAESPGTKAHQQHHLGLHL